jgi:hypothetical protein
MTLFLRLLDDENKALSLQKSVRSESGRVFNVDPRTFESVPSSPFSYWVSDQIRHLFKQFSQFESSGRTARIGVQGSNDFRWVRLTWEIKQGPSYKGFEWRPLAKGGKFSKFYSDIHLKLAWNAKRETVFGFIGRAGRMQEKPPSVDHYFRPGITWPLRTQSGLGMRALPLGCIFTNKGPSAFVTENDPIQLMSILGITTSSVFRYLVDLQMAFGSYEVGVIQRTPIPEVSGPDQKNLSSLTHVAWAIRMRIDSTSETSHSFLLPTALRIRLGEFDPAILEKELSKIQFDIDNQAFRLYGLDDEGRAEIEAWARKGGSVSEGEAEVPVEDQDEDDEAISTSDNDALLSWAVGVAFGRFDIRLATGERLAPSEPEPFDPLPAKSPGMLPDGDAPFRATMGIFTDDPGHTDDLRSSVADVLERVNLPVPENLRTWLAKEYFSLHIKLYSKSRRKAPIYWQLATPSASYSTWIYIHAFNKDTLYRVQNDYAAPKLRHEERKLESVRTEAGADPKSDARKALAEQESFVEELQTFLEELKRVAPLWNPNLDDGVVINFAPLWRLVPQHKSWQKELKSTWDSLCEGEYDWSHLAMHLWPERVVPKCADDRSLAIAHDLETVFWNEGTDGKWKKLEIETSKMAGLIQDKTSPAVKAALKELLEAPYANGTKSGLRNRKAK